MARQTAANNKFLRYIRAEYSGDDERLSSIMAKRYSRVVELVNQNNYRGAVEYIVGNTMPAYRERRRKELEAIMPTVSKAPADPTPAASEAAPAVCPRCGGDEWVDATGFATGRVPCPECQDTRAGRRIPPLSGVTTMAKQTAANNKFLRKVKQHRNSHAYRHVLERVNSAGIDAALEWLLRYDGRIVSNANMNEYRRIYGLPETQPDAAPTDPTPAASEPTPADSEAWSPYVKALRQRNAELERQLADARKDANHNQAIALEVIAERNAANARAERAEADAAAFEAILKTVARWLGGGS